MNKTTGKQIGTDLYFPLYFFVEVFFSIKKPASDQ